VFRFLVHIVNPVSGWVVTQVHVIAEDAETAIGKALTAFGLNESDVSQTLKVIPQVIGTVVDDEKSVVEQEAETVEAEPVTPAVVETEAESTAAKVLASLPADVLAAVEAALKSK
jgi:hypothetical protein